MRLGFYLADTRQEPYRMAESWVKRARRAMPDTEICQLTDETSQSVIGVDRVLRQPKASSFTRTLAQAYQQPGDWLFADTDVVIQHDVREVFEDQQWQVALASRDGTFISQEEQASAFMQMMPYNTGVVFSRCPQFWDEVDDLIERLHEKHQRWYGMQLAVAELVKLNRYRVRVLEPDFNYPPKAQDEDVSMRHLVHYKGPRKRWLLDRISSERAA